MFYNRFNDLSILYSNTSAVIPPEPTCVDDLIVQESGGEAATTNPLSNSQSDKRAGTLGFA